MCGIAGYAGAVDPTLPRALDVVAAALAHRGPDGRGRHVATFDHGQAELALVHARLAVVDLAGGGQPLASEDGRVVLVCNGEIYNHRALRAQLQGLGHRFASRSDSEVIVHAYEQWGDECVHRLRGMFAFALWDAGRERLFLARDRYGEKPLFLLEDAAGLRFASELGALAAWPGVDARLNLAMLPRYLQYRYAPGPHTWMHGVSKLPPGCRASWTRAAGLVEERYFHAPVGRPATRAAPGEAEAAHELRHRLGEAVQLMLDCDVPVGAFLSGGVDSASLVALMARHGSHAPRTFSVGFGDPLHDELAPAREIAAQLGAHHTELLVSAHDAAEHLEAVAARRDGPMAEPADVPMYLLSRAARREVTVVFTGEGSDEAFAGYPKHRVEPWVGCYHAVPAPLRQGLIEPLLHALPGSARRLRIAGAAAREESFSRRMPRWFGALDAAGVQALCGRLPPSALNGCAYPFDTEAGTSALRRVLHFDQTSWLPDNLLERGDRVTMAASLESRMPFMDHEVMAWAATLPDAWLLRGGLGKRILRRAMEPMLPAAVTRRRKRGFPMPLAAWLRGAWRDRVAAHLLGSDSRVARLLNRHELTRLWQEHQQARRDHDKLLWSLFSLDLWLRHTALRP